MKYTDPDGREVKDLDNAQKAIVQEKLKEAKTNLLDLSTKLQNYINDDNPNKLLDASIKDASKIYLGIDLKDNRSVKRVLNGVNKTLSYLNSLKISDFKFDTEGRTLDSRFILAYVYTGLSGLFDKKIYLTQYFFNLQNSGDLNKTGTIVHEGTHKGLGTDDIAYPDMENFKDLSPQEKFNNAASWERFFNRIYKNGQ